MRGSIETDGTVRITFNSQCESLRAPDRVMPDGSREPQQWLPCSWCGRLHPQFLSVVAFTCQECARQRDVEQGGDA